MMMKTVKGRATQRPNRASKIVAPIIGIAVARMTSSAVSGIRSVEPGWAGITNAEFIDRYSDEELAIVVDFVRRGANLMKEQTARIQRGKRER